MYLLYLLKKILKQKAYFFTRREGMLFFDGSQEYFIASENYEKNKLSRDGYGVAIFSKKIQAKNSDKSITDIEKNKIALELKILLNKKKIITTIV